MSKSVTVFNVQSFQADQEPNKCNLRIYIFTFSWIWGVNVCLIHIHGLWCTIAHGGIQVFHTTPLGHYPGLEEPQIHMAPGALFPTYWDICILCAYEQSAAHFSKPLCTMYVCMRFNCFCVLLLVRLVFFFFHISLLWLKNIIKYKPLWHV